MVRESSSISRKKLTTSRKKSTSSSRKKPSTQRKKSTSSRKKPIASRKKSTASRKKSTNPSSLRKKPDHTVRALKQKAGGNETQFKNVWESKFTVRKGEPWRVYLFEFLPKNKFAWGLYGPSKEDFIQHMQLGAMNKRQPLEFVHDAQNANLVVVGDYSDNETRKVATAQFSSFIISSVLALKLLTEDQRDDIMGGYQDRLRQEHAITYDKHGVHYH